MEDLNKEGGQVEELPSEDEEEDEQTPVRPNEEQQEKPKQEEPALAGAASPVQTAAP